MTTILRDHQSILNHNMKQSITVTFQNCNSHISTTKTLTKRNFNKKTLYFLNEVNSDDKITDKYAYLLWMLSDE